MCRVIRAQIIVALALFAFVVIALPVACVLRVAFLAIHCVFAAIVVIFIVWHAQLPRRVFANARTVAVFATRPAAVILAVTTAAASTGFPVGIVAPIMHTGLCFVQRAAHICVAHLAVWFVGRANAHFDNCKRLGKPKRQPINFRFSVADNDSANTIQTIEHRWHRHVVLRFTARNAANGR